MPNSPSPQVAQESRAGIVAVDGRTFPLEAVEVRTRAGGGLAATTLTQQFKNPHAEPLEVTYTLPLPADGAVVGYSIHAGERVIRGEVEKRETAEKRFREALIEGRTAGLLDQERADTFTQRLGCLPPGVPVRVEIEVLQPLGFQAGAAAPEWEYRFPTVAGVRYEGEPGRVPDAAKLDTPRAGGDGTPVRVQLDLIVEDGAPETISPRSTTHALVVSAVPGDGDRSAVAFPAAARLDRDLVVRWRAAGATVGAALREGPGLPGDGGRYALITVTPPAVPQATTPRDLTLLIDASGSMSGAPIETAKRIATALLESLGTQDRFEILAFSSSVERLTDGVVDAGEPNIHRARRRLADLRAGGATEMVSALHAALTPLRPDAQRQVVLLTDGQIGFESQAIGEILAKLPAGARLHAVGIGSAPNRTLTRGASRAGRGIELIAGNGDDGGKAAQRLCNATAAPVLTEVAVRGSAVAGTAPERLRDVFAGAPLLVAVELRPEGGAVEVRGTLAGQSEPWTQRIEVAPRAAQAVAGDRAALPLGALFGRERIEDCEMRLAASRGGSETEGLLDQIEALGLCHRIASRRTSLVAIAEEPTADPTQPTRRERLAVEMPAEVSAEGVGYYPAVVPACRESMDLGLPLFIPTVAQQVCKFRIPLPPDFAVKFRQPGPEAASSRILDLNRRRLVVEFEAPEGGIEVPSGKLEIRADDEVIARAAIVPKMSTRPGPVDSGLTVRLVLEIGDPTSEWSAFVTDWEYASGPPRTLTLLWPGGGGEFTLLLERA